MDVDNKKMITKIISKFSNQVSTNILTTSELEPELKKILNDYQDIKKLDQLILLPKDKQTVQDY